MQITALPIPFYRAASNRPPELSQTAAVRLKLLEQWRAVRAEGAPSCEPPTSSISPAPTSTAGRPGWASADCALSNPITRPSPNTPPCATLSCGECAQWERYAVAVRRVRALGALPHHTQEVNVLWLRETPAQSPLMPATG